jgi:hypothetical protein
MPARPRLTRCYCSQCVSNGGLDTNGQPKGVVFTSQALLVAHQARLANERRATSAAPVEPPSEMADLESSVFALTLTDDGPDHNGQPSRLWSSRADFQEGNSQRHVLSDPSTNDILAAFERLSLSQPHSNQPSSSHASVATGPIHAASPVSVQQRTMQKKEKNKRTTTALQVLASIETKVEACRTKLTAVPTKEVLTRVKSTLAELRSALECIKRHTPTIDTRKQGISLRLDALEARLTEWRLIIPESNTPITYDSGELLLRPAHPTLTKY